MTKEVLNDNTDNDKYCYINGLKFERSFVTKMTLNDFEELVKEQMPLHLYRYYPNLTKVDGSNYSLSALENNTVFLNDPNMFDDCQDSLITFIDDDFVQHLIDYYAKLCNCEFRDNLTFAKKIEVLTRFINDKIKERKSLEDILNWKNIKNESLKQHIGRTVFLLRVKYANKNVITYQDLMEIINKHKNEAKELLQARLKKKFRITCFATTPFCERMWVEYSNNNKGFCLEYQIKEMNNKQLKKFLFPVIYGNDNVSVSKQCVDIMLFKDDNKIWEMLKYGLLRKTLEWKYQNEWRLVSFDTLLADAGNYNCFFYPITRVYLGNCMEDEQRAKIIDLCKKKGIPYDIKYI